MLGSRRGCSRVGGDAPHPRVPSQGGLWPAGALGKQRLSVGSEPHWGPYVESKPSKAPERPAHRREAGAGRRPRHTHSQSPPASETPGTARDAGVRPRHTLPNPRPTPTRTSSHSSAAAGSFPAVALYLHKSTVTVNIYVGIWDADTK